jgi:hypothetical protein
VEADDYYCSDEEVEQMEQWSGDAYWTHAEGDLLDDCGVLSGPLDGGAPLAG